MSHQEIFQKKIKRYLIKRLGDKNVDVLVNVNFVPTQNSMVVEHLIPKLISTKLTNIQSRNEKLPVLNDHLRSVSKSTFRLPELPDFDQRLMVTSNPILLADKLEEDRSQKWMEHIYYDKKVETIKFSPVIQSMSLILFLPDHLIQPVTNQAVISELNHLFNLNELILFNVIIRPIRSRLWTYKFIDDYERFIVILLDHWAFALVVFFLLIMLIVLIMYLRFKIRSVRSFSQTKIDLQPNSSKVNQNDHQSDNLTFSSNPNQLVRFFLKGMTSE
ncbi:MAG: hypothetical protein VW397_08155 [Candidatus Margulisiibacteriota bacterium]